MRGLILLSLLFASACSGAPGDCSGTGSGQCSLTQHDSDEPVRRGEFNALIQSYLDEHPEVIVEMGQKLRVKQAAERQANSSRALAESRAAVFDDAGDPVLGNPRGDVTVVEFFDNECPFCKRLSPALEQLVSTDPGVRLVLKEYPILGPGSEMAARYALAALRQGKYAAFHGALMEDKTPEHQLAEPRLLEIATMVGLDVARLSRDVGEPEISQRIESNRALARKLTITGTPGLIIGERIESGALSLQALQQAVANERHARQPAS